MSPSEILEDIAFGILALCLIAVLLAAAKNVRGPRKGRYRLSWFERK